MTDDFWNTLRAMKPGDTEPLGFGTVTLSADGTTLHVSPIGLVFDVIPAPHGPQSPKHIVWGPSYELRDHERREDETRREYIDRIKMMFASLYEERPAWRGPPVNA